MCFEFANICSEFANMCFEFANIKNYEREKHLFWGKYIGNLEITEKMPNFATGFFLRFHEAFL